MVLPYGWIEEEMLTDMIAVSESTPGPIMVNLATYIGSSQAGFPGALIATIAVVLPSFIIILLIMILLKKLLKNPFVQAILRGLKPCIIGILYSRNVPHADRDALLNTLAGNGWQIKRGKQPSFCGPDGKRFIRMDSLGEAYAEKSIREVLDGLRVHNPYKTRRMKSQVSLLIDIQAKMQEGKGKGYENWAKVFNVKQMASSMAYLSSHNIKSYEELATKVEAAVQKNEALLTEVRTAEARLKEIAAMKKSIHDYLKTKDVYAEWKKLGYDKHFYAEHEQEIIIHKAAKKAFDAIPGKIPTIKALSAEYSEVLTQKQAAYAHYRETRDSMRELLTVKANIDMVTNRHMPAKSIRNREVKR